MSLDSNNLNNNDQPKANNSNNNAGATNPLFALLAAQNLISSSHHMSEVSDVVKSIEDTLEVLNKNTASEAQKLSLPKDVNNTTSDISPNLPGIVLSNVIGGTAYVQPVLFFKTGVTEVTETLFIANESLPRATAKPAASFMDQTLLEKVRSAYSVRNGKQMNNVIIISPLVINLEVFIKNQVKQEEMVEDIRNVILKEWSTGLLNIATLDIAKAGIAMPNPFKDSKLFGKDDAAVARIEPVNKLIIDGKPTPYNLAVKVSTTNKNNTQNSTSSQTRSVATSYLNVALEAMGPQQFQQARAARPGQPVGPLVPVISTGVTIPGETLNNNNSLLTALLGLYASIGANNISYFTEAFRSKEVGNRGNLGNFNFYLSQILGQAYQTQQFLTDKNITNQQVVTNWLTTYVAPQAVYVLDLATFSDDSANADFWWNLVNKPAGSTYHRALVNMADALSGNQFSVLAKDNANKVGRDLRNEWAPGDAILRPTNIILPNGIAQGKDGKWFNLAEVDAMFLRQDQYYGNNEIAINEYQALTHGAVGGDNLKVRQFNIYNRLNQLFNSNVIVDGWNRRLVWENAFFATFAKAMATAGVLSLSGSNMSSMWTINTGNEYLNNVISAALSQNIQAGGMGFNGSYSQY